MKEDIKQQQQYKQVPHQAVKLSGKICKHSTVTDWNPAEPRQVLAGEIGIVHQEQNSEIIDVTIEYNFHYIYRLPCNIAITHILYRLFNDKSNFVTRQRQKNYRQ